VAQRNSACVSGYPDFLQATLTSQLKVNDSFCLRKRSRLRLAALSTVNKDAASSDCHRLCNMLACMKIFACHAKHACVFCCLGRIVQSRQQHIRLPSPTEHRVNAAFELNSNQSGGRSAHTCGRPSARHSCSASSGPARPPERALMKTSSGAAGMCGPAASGLMSRRYFKGSLEDEGECKQCCMQCHDGGTVYQARIRLAKE
jgi:hypothetical protein